jgi:hypothetical protein
LIVTLDTPVGTVQVAGVPLKLNAQGEAVGDVAQSALASPTTCPALSLILGPGRCATAGLEVVVAVELIMSARVAVVMTTAVLPAVGVPVAVPKVGEGCGTALATIVGVPGSAAPLATLGRASAPSPVSSSVSDTSHESTVQRSLGQPPVRPTNMGKYSCATLRR